MSKKRNKEMAILSFFSPSSTLIVQRVPTVSPVSPKRKFERYSTSFLNSEAKLIALRLKFHPETFFLSLCFTIPRPPHNRFTPLASHAAGAAYCRHEPAALHLWHQPSHAARLRHVHRGL